MRYFSEAGLILVEFLFGLLIGLFVVRVLLQVVRANFHNPICQFFYRATNPVLVPMRRWLPPVGRVDSAATLIALLLCVIQVWLLGMLSGVALPLLATLVLAVGSLISVLLTLYFWLIVVRIILSFLSPDAYHPVVPLLGQLTEPVLRPLRRILPATGAFDFSPLLATLIIVLAQVLVVAPINDLGAWLVSA